MTRIPSLTTGEDAHGRGLAHGRRFAQEIADNVATYLRRFAASGLSRDAAFAEAEHWLAAMRTWNSEYAEEMRGVAQGSRQSDEAIALLNARYELAFTLFGQDARAGEKELSEQTKEILAVGPDGCTAFGLLPQATADHHTWLGQNWDWLEGVHGRTFVLRVQRKDKPSFVCFTEAGMVGGKMGVNECGIGLVETGLASSHDGRHPYEKPFHMRCREILDAETFEDARKSVTGTPRTCSANFVIGKAGGAIVNIETSPDHTSDILPEDGILTHSNHFLTPGHGESLMEKLSPNTLHRVDRMRHLLRERGGNISFDHMRQAVTDHRGAPYAICRHPDPEQPDAKRTMTDASILIDLDARMMHVANGPPCSNEHVPFTIDED